MTTHTSRVCRAAIDPFSSSLLDLGLFSGRSRKLNRTWRVVLININSPLLDDAGLLLVVVVLSLAFLTGSPPFLSPSRSPGGWGTCPAMFRKLTDIGGCWWIL